MSWRDAVKVDPETPLDDEFGSGKGHCTRCGAEWFGSKICHCSTCHLTFTAVGGFDEHRTGKTHHFDPALDTRRCRRPEELRERGLEPNDEGQWRRPRPLDTLPGGVAS